MVTPVGYTVCAALMTMNVFMRTAPAATTNLKPRIVASLAKVVNSVGRSCTADGGSGTSTTVSISRSVSLPSSAGGGVAEGRGGEVKGSSTLYCFLKLDPD